ncbi:DASH complex subunit Ask1-domain-containing protein [Tirmania nivea]|nr:DASH complex subunit Ask1-domain-containing protein [Tirmania nivea]
MYQINNIYGNWPWLDSLLGAGWVCSLARRGVLVGRNRDKGQTIVTNTSNQSETEFTMLAQKPKKTLTLPEELEKIEQQITLTLQEIDHNFNKAHRIVTSSIIPVVERFGNESKTVWESSKFWKQFFEASANVCLNNYEEPTTTFTEEQSTLRHEEGGENNARQEGYYSEEEGRGEAEEYYEDEEDITVTSAKEGSRMDEEEDIEDDEDKGVALADVSTDSLLASLSLEKSTPKASRGTTKWADIDSRYQQTTKDFTRPVPPRRPQPKKEEASFSLGSSPEEPPGLPAHLESPSFHAPSTPRRGGARRPPPRNPVPTRNSIAEPTAGHQDPLLHRVLDKNYRIQATPRGKSAPSRYLNLPSATPRRRGGLFSSGVKPQTYTRAGGVAFDDDDDLLSSPLDSPAPPELQTQFLDSLIHRPSRAANVPSIITSTTASSRRFQVCDNPRTPSRHNPSRPKPPVPHPVSAKKMGFGSGVGFDEDDEDDDLMLPPGFSPPVTIQFSLPQRTILATPARVASKRLVQDILRTAGADESGSTEASNAGRMGGDDEDYELDMGAHGSSAQQMKEWRRSEASGSGRGRGRGRGIFAGEASPTIIRGRGMDLGDETF